MTPEERKERADKLLDELGKLYPNGTVFFGSISEKEGVYAAQEMPDPPADGCPLLRAIYARFEDLMEGDGRPPRYAANDSPRVRKETLLMLRQFGKAYKRGFILIHYEYGNASEPVVHSHNPQDDHLLAEAFSRMTVPPDIDDGEEWKHGAPVC